MNSYKTLQEKAKAKGKLLLIESVSYIPKSEDVIVFTSKDNKFTEAKGGKQFEARGVLKNVPITRYTENANGRIYSRNLWENVQKSGLFEGSDSLANHAEDDGNVLDQVGVWHNLQIGEDTATADLYCIGAAGNLLLEKIKAGGKTGFSSVGFGELSESGPLAGKEVIPESYEYSNTDWVMKPSQGVYGTQENLGESVQTQKENKIIESIITNNIQTKKVEVNKKMDKYLELSIKNQIKSTIKEAIANENCVEAIRELKEVSETIVPEMAEQKAQVEAAIVQIQTKLAEQKESAKLELRESKETLETLTKKYKESCAVIDVLNEKLEKASKIVEKATDKDIVKSMKIMEEDIAQFSKDRVLMESDIAVLREEIKHRDADLKSFEEDTILRDKDINKFKEERVKMKKKMDKTSKQLEVAEKHIKGLEKILKEEFDYTFEDEMGLDDSDKDKKEKDIFDGDLEDDDMFMDDDLMSDPEEEEYIFEAESDEDEDSKEDDEEDKKELDEADEDEDKDKDDSEDEDKDNSNDDMKEAEDDDEDDKEEDDDEDDKEDDKEDADDKMAAVRAAKESIQRLKKASVKPVVKEAKGPAPEIISYYKECVKAKPAVKDIQKEILSSKSLLEAVKKVNAFGTKFGNDVHKIKESKKDNKQEFVPYKFKI